MPELTLEELKAQLDTQEAIVKQCSYDIDVLFAKQAKEQDKYFDLERAYNKLLLKDIKVEIGSFFYLKNENYSYHDKKEILICVDNINEKENVCYREFIVRDDDGDESFYIEKRTLDIVDFKEALHENNFIEIDKAIAQEKIDSFLKI